MAAKMESPSDSKLTLIQLLAKIVESDVIDKLDTELLFKKITDFIQKFSSAAMPYKKLPDSQQRKLNLATALIIIYLLLLFINMVLSVIGVVLAGSDPDVSTFNRNIAITTAALSPFWLIFLSLEALIWWYTPLSLAYATDYPSNCASYTTSKVQPGFTVATYLFFFIIMVIQCFVWLIIPIGAPGVNVGIISGIYMMLYVNVPLGAIWIAASVLWIPLFIGGVAVTVSILRNTINNGVYRGKSTKNN